MAGRFNSDDAIMNTLPSMLVLMLQRVGREMAGPFSKDDAIINTLPCM